MKTYSIFIWIIVIMISTTYSNPDRYKSGISSDNFKITSVPVMISITLISPNGGENFSAGDIHEINWTSEAIENVKIDYSTNNGINWITINNSTSAATGSYRWLVPNTPSENCRVLVSDASNALINDQSNNIFTILPPPPPVITFTVDLKYVSPPITETDIIAVRGKYSPLSWFQNYKMDLTTNNIYKKTIDFESSVIDSALEYKFVIERSGSGIQWEQNVGPGDGGNRVYIIQPGEMELPVVFFDSTSRYIDFETLGQNFNWTIFGNGTGGNQTDFTTALNPNIESINPSRHCGKYFVRADAETWSGISTEDIEPFILSDHNSTIKIMVYKDVISNFNLKLEGPELNEDHTVSNSVINQWEMLTFDYSAHIGKTINKLTIIPDYVLVRNSASTNYFDNFSIGPQPSIILTSPNGGEIWQTNSVGTITWASESIENVKIDYSTNNGVNWINIIQSIPANSGNYNWIIPNTPSPNCKVLISDVSNALLKDESDGVFTISPTVLPAIQLNSPNGGENWFVGSTQNITWTSNDIQNVKIDYSTNNGTNWINIIPSTSASAGSYMWTVPNTPSENCAVLISDVNNALLNDQSNEQFTISPSINPELTVTSPNGGEYWQSGKSINITWTSTAVMNVQIDYSTNDGLNWIGIVASVPASSGVYSWSVPQTPSSNCKVLISDVSNALINDQSNNVFSIFDYNSSITLNTTLSFGDITKTSNYKAIGLPGEANIALASIMTGSPGKENDWRAFWDDGSLPLVEYNGSNTFNFTPGKAFFVISKNQIVINQNINAVQLAADNSFSIPLHNEWNLISNPFNRAVSWSNVQNTNSASQPIHYFLNGSYSSQVNFEPYKGYYFFNSTGLTTLKIPYDPSGTLNKRDYKLKKELEVFLISNDNIISQITLGVSESSNNGIDDQDIYAPPSQLCEVGMFFLNDELNTNYKYLQSDYRPAIGEGQEFCLSVKNMSDQSLSMNFTGLNNFNDYEVYLLDRDKSVSYDLKQTGIINVKNNTTTKKYGILIGTKEFINKKMNEIIPSEFVLNQNYPNPFNPGTNISWQSPISTVQTIKIYDALGREVLILVDEFKPAGKYEVEFNPESVMKQLASGVYFYQLKAGSFVQTKKMILLR